MTPSSPDACQRTRSPTTASLFLPRVWQRTRAPSSPSTSKRRPCPETTLPSRAAGKPSAEEGDEGIGFGGADEVVRRDAAGGMGREADDAMVEADGQVGMMVLDVAHPREGVDERHRLEPALEGEPLLDRAVGVAPAAHLGEVVADRVLAHGAGACLALLGKEIGHGAIGSDGRPTSAARRSTAGGCE